METPDLETTGSLVLLSILTRALVANGTLTKIDLLAELSRVSRGAPASVVSQIQELIQNLPDR